jgi:outer membrane protein assembly factor BamB
VTATPDILERTFPAPPDSFERLTRRRAHRARTRRITEGALALVLVILLVAALVGTLARRQQRSVPLNGPITPSNVSQLGLVWSSPAGAGVDTQALVVGGHVYVIDDNQYLRVYPTSCGAAICAPLWTTKLGSAGLLPWGAPTTSGDRVYVPTGDGRLLAFATDCVSDCRPVWSARLGDDMSSTSPVVVDGIVYVASDASPVGLIGAFAETCPRSPKPCPPLWRGELSLGFVGSQPAVVNGVVYVGSTTGTLYAFPTSCAQTGGRCSPLWTTTFGEPPYAVYSHMITPILATDSSVIVASGSALHAYPTTCTRAGIPCRPTWTAHVQGWINFLTSGGDSLYVSSGNWAASETQGRISVIPPACARRCTPTTTFHVPQGGNLTVADGVLYIGWIDGASAFDARCGAGDSCTPLWSAPGHAWSDVQPPSVADGIMYTGDASGRIYAFGLGGTAAVPGARPARAANGTSTWYGVFYGALLAAIAAFFVIRRRRTARQASDR